MAIIRFSSFTEDEKMKAEYYAGEEIEDFLSLMNFVKQQLENTSLIKNNLQDLDAFTTTVLTDLNNYYDENGHLKAKYIGQVLSTYTPREVKVDEENFNNKD